MLSSTAARVAAARSSTVRDDASPLLAEAFPAASVSAVGGGRVFTTELNTSRRAASWRSSEDLNAPCTPCTDRNCVRHDAPRPESQPQPQRADRPGPVPTRRARHGYRAE